MLARAIIGILPNLTLDEQLELSSIYSIANQLRDGLISERPFRSPHHTASNVALVGGGNNVKPGEITLAHRGVLFLDEFPEFSRNVLEALRQPLEDGKISVARAKTSLTFPAEFILLAAQNPCPCGFYGDKQLKCLCFPGDLHKYQRKLSGPLLDRIDLQVKVDRVSFSELQSAVNSNTETSNLVREKVEFARAIQAQRYSKNFVNARISPVQIKQYCKLDELGLGLLENASKKFNLSPRQIHRILKVSRTIADLAGVKDINNDHLAEAMRYRISGIY